MSHIIQILIAIGALLTARYARKSFKQTNQMFEEERLSKKGQLASAEKRGGLRDGNKQLRINLKNYGINTINDVIVDILLYEKDSISKKGKKQIPGINHIAYSRNPLPRNANFIITLNIENPIPDSGSTPYFVIARIKYFDVMLEQIFDNEYFFWQLDGRNILDEIEPKDEKRIRNVLKFDEEYWTFISKDNKKRQKKLEDDERSR